MPILDPLLQISLLFCEKNDCSVSHKPFFLKYLKVASDNLYRDINTIEASIQFRKDLQNNIIIFCLIAQFQKDITDHVPTSIQNGF